ncbi:MAG: hypothetical protein KGR26_05915, partial [Cyanobacteria bacterium REEB65]|nr:hypothetical protein [Cyanobacteria bacterium REEB65]
MQSFTLSQVGQTKLGFPASAHLALLLSASGSALAAPVSFGAQALQPSRAGSKGDVSYTASGATLRGPLASWGDRQSYRGPNLGLWRVQDAPSELPMWINMGLSTSQSDCQREVKLAYSSGHAFFYIDDGPGPDATGSCAGPAGYRPTAQQWQEMGKAFEVGFSATADPVPGAAPIYSSVTGLFGPDPAGDSPPAGDPVFVVLSPAVDGFGAQKGLLGYFWDRDMQPISGDPNDPRIHSNERPAIFLTDGIFAQKPYTTYGTLAHEFTHLVVYYQRTKAQRGPNETWWDEGLAMLSMDHSGYGFRAGNADIAKDLGAFLDQPASYSLTDWTQDPHGFAYGLSGLWARYLYDRFGPAFIREVELAPDGGVTGLDAALAERGTTFETTYEDFMVAVFASSQGLQLGGRWQLASDLDMRGTYDGIQLGGVATQASPPSGGVRLPPWG